MELQDFALNTDQKQWREPKGVHAAAARGTVGSDGCIIATAGLVLAQGLSCFLLKDPGTGALFTLANERCWGTHCLPSTSKGGANQLLPGFESNQCFTVGGMSVSISLLLGLRRALIKDAKMMFRSVWLFTAFGPGARDSPSEKENTPHRDPPGFCLWGKPLFR